MLFPVVDKVWLRELNHPCKLHVCLGTLFFLFLFSIMDLLLTFRLALDFDISKLLMKLSKTTVYIILKFKPW